MKLRSRLFLYMSVLALGTAVLTWALSFFFLEPFYMARKRSELMRIAREIGDLPDTLEGEYGELASLERSTAVHITIADSSGRVTYDSNQAGASGVPEARPRRDGGPPGFPPRESGRPPPFLPAEPFPGEGRPLHRPLPIPVGEPERGTSIFETADPNLGVKLLFLVRRQESGSVLALSFPLAPIHESARAGNLFLLVSCVLALIAGAGLSFALSRSLAELEERNVRLQQDVLRERRIDALRRDFISSVSHELKTPIALILGYAEGLMENVPKDRAERKEYLEVIRDEARKMDAQVRDLLELSQLESGAVPLRKSAFDLGALAVEVLESFAYVLNERGVEPTLRREEVPVFADQEKIRRAIVNFLTNALEHLDDFRRLEIDASREGAGGRFSVYNSGPWIPEGSLELIWNSYYKTDTARSRKFGGTGLGLAIVRGIVGRHGGTWKAENLPAAEGRPAGVRFSFTIPGGEG